ncbi:MAG: hypothetical protein KKD18_01910 [Nanoarchaeota archaeon]|nr:hypothetical protein [Nanoarchaeota archaeon]
MDEVAYIEYFNAIAGIFPIILAIAIITYIYISIAAMALAKKTGTKHGWLAWIPFANFYLYSKMAGMHWWPIFLLVGMFIPNLDIFALVAFTIFNFIWFWKILDKVNKPGWWVLFNIVPGFGWLIFLILLGVATWSEDERPFQFKTPQEATAITPKNLQQKRTRQLPPKISSPRLDRIKKLKGSLK